VVVLEAHVTDATARADVEGGHALLGLSHIA
jgi:hypothetical protein